ncbi:tyrosine-type recombinase/integrase [Bacillus sp. JJ1122]|uniref:tyrosine-type recombinase/integrase n=1 Tax=Bacillus sp. JJ1122 TaxID=3122951 RepID=UPI002FFF55D0
MRHLHATQLMISGVNPKVVQERLGHSRVAITLDLYSHVNEDLQVEAAIRLRMISLIMEIGYLGNGLLVV